MRFLAALVVVAGGVAVGSAPAGGPERPGDAPGRALVFTPSDAPLLNPERGFYRTVRLATDRSFGFVRAGGDTLVYSYVRLDDYRDRPIARSLLEGVEAGLDALRQAGLKVVLRFAYNFGPYPDSEPDAPLDRVLAHIAQVEPLLRRNEDVIALVQAGFIGAWGEWHSSTHGLHADPGARRAVIDALLEALPPGRSTQLRYPPHKKAMFGEPLAASEAFSSLAAARIGHHNDCFLSSETDVGTYPAGERQTWVAYLAEETRYLPMGGETCRVFEPLSGCGVAPREMERLHFSFLNRDYHRDVVRGWAAGGCLPLIERQLGYRFVMTDARLPDAVRPGGSFRLLVRVRNDGWAAPMNPRPVRLVLSGEGERHEVRLPGSDVRRWGPAETAEVDVRLRLPASLPPGAYTLALFLPDAAERLRSRPAYAIRTANAGTWDAANGWNTVGAIAVDPGADGGADPAAAAFRLLVP